MIMPRPRRRRWWLLPPLLFLLVAGLHTAVWRAAAARLSQGFDNWAGERRALGWTLRHGTPTRGGWPLHVSLTVPGFDLSGGPRTAPAGLAWQAEKLDLRVALLDWDRLVVAPSGRQRFEIAGQEYPFAADRVELTLPLEGGSTPREGVLEVERLRLNSPWGGFDLRRGSLALRSRLSATEAEPALNAELSLRELGLPVPGPGSLGQHMALVELEGSLSGPLPPIRQPTQRAEAWRDAGGTPDLRRVELRWGPVTTTLSATGTLDEALQPMGAGQIQMLGAAEAIEAMVAAGLVSRAASGALRAVATLLARPDPDGGPPLLELPITLQDRRIGLARLPLVRLPVLEWPPPPEVPDAARDPSLPGND